MKRNQDGSIGIAVLIGFVAISAATISVINSGKSLDYTTRELKQEREVSDTKNAALNALSKFKALVNDGKTTTPGLSVKPGAYLVDYFKLNPFVFMTSKEVKDAGIQPRNNVIFDLSANSPSEANKNRGEGNVEVDHAVSVFRGESPAVYETETFAIKVDKLNVRTSGSGAGYLIENADVLVTNKKTGEDMFRAQVNLPYPKPRNPILTFRDTSDPSSKEQPVTKSTTFVPGTYEFKAYGSGVFTSASIIVDSKETLVGVDSKGNPTHKGVNYDSQHVFVGSVTQEIGSILEIDPALCKAVPASGSNAKKINIAVGLNAVSGIKSDNQTVVFNNLNVAGDKDSSRALTVADYRNQCKEECPYVGADPIPGSLGEDSSAKAITDAHNTSNVGDLSGSYTFYKAKEFKVTSKKLCVNIDGLKEEGNYFSKAKFYTYDIPSCKRRFLTARNSCGCVAEDTLILMGDGRTEKRIDQIVESDTIWNPLLKKAFSIRKMTRGPETVPLLAIVVAGKDLKVTGNHPFPTREGMKAAFALNAGEEIMVEGMGWKSIASITSIEAGAAAPIVWNIEIEAPDTDWNAHHYVANGLVTGDLMIQVKLQNARLTAKN